MGYGWIEEGVTNVISSKFSFIALCAAGFQNIELLSVAAGPSHPAAAECSCRVVIIIIIIGI